MGSEMCIRDSIKMKVNIVLARLLAFSFFNDIGSSIFAFAVNLYILQVTGSALAFSTGMVIIPIANIVFFPISGYIVDNFAKKKVIMVSLALAAGSLSLTLLFLASLGKALIWVLLVQLFILRMCDILVQSALMTLIPQLFERDLQRINALLQAVMRFTGVIGPIVAGILFYLVPFVNIGILEVSFDFLALLLFGGIEVKSEKQLASRSKNSKTHLGKVLRYISQEKLVSSYLILCIFSNLVLASFQIGAPFLMLHVLGYTSIEYGIVEAFFAIGAVLGSIVLAFTKIKLTVKNSYQTFGMIGLGTICLGLVLAFPKNFVTFLLIMTAVLAIGTSMIISNIAMVTLLQQQIKQAVQGHIFTAFDTLVTASLPIFSLLFGGVFQNFAGWWILLISGSLMLLAVLGILSSGINENL